MLLPESINIEHFHLILEKILNKTPLARRVGRTTTLLYWLLSEAMFVEVPEKTNFLFVTRTKTYARRCMIEFLYLLEKFDIEIEHITEYGNYVRTASGITFYFSSSMFCSDLYGRTYHRILNDDSAKDPSSDFSEFCKNIF